jgi:hypothetical protein
MWNSKLVKKATEIARSKHPEGFNKQQLIDASKEVYGGFGANPNKPIKTRQDVSDMGNYMSEIDGHYPRSMSSCFIVGINGGCGKSCPMYGSKEEPKCEYDEFAVN